MLAWAVAASIAPQLGSAILRSPIWPIDILAAHKLEMSDLRNTVCKQHQIRTRSGRGLPGRWREDHAWPRAGVSTSCDRRGWKRGGWPGQAPAMTQDSVSYN